MLSIKIGRSKESLFPNGMLVYIENPKESYTANFQIYKATILRQKYREVPWWCSG